MALVRVYCGLASADAGGRAPGPGPSLTAAIVDDSGRLLSLSDLADEPAGYSELSLLLAERGAGPYSVAVAADRDDRLVPNLLVTAGWALAFTDEAAAESFAERYSDDLTDEGVEAPHHRRAVGLARALHAGALSATLLPPPAGLAAIKPLLTAHGALATGRQAAATALREVLRELYPAALRAYADPCDPVALAVLEAVPEPGRLAVGAAARSREAITADELVAELTRGGAAEERAAAEAVHALRTAVAEMPRPTSLSRAFTGPVAEAVRNAVAAVRAYDTADAALIGALAERVTRAPSSAEADSTLTPTPGDSTGTGAADQPAGRRRSRAATHTRPTSAPPTGRRSRARAANALDAFPSPGLPQRPARLADARPTAPEPVAPPPTAPEPVSPPPSAPEPLPSRSAAEAAQVTSAPPVRGRPVSAPPPPPPGIAPIAEPRPPRQVRRQPEPAASAPRSEPVGARSTPQGPPPGSRSHWPTNPADDDWAADPLTATGDRVVPPWRDDDLQTPEEPPLRLVEPTLPEELRGDLDGAANGWSEPGPLRLVEHAGPPQSVPPVAASAEDDDLLIFAQTRSAWFSGQGEEVSWTSRMDEGWQAAEQAANPDISQRTEAGLPRRVPHANLVPGSPPRGSERPLRIVRNPSEIAKHTSGYFNGWRRGQQIGGFPLGGRVGRQSVGAWDFSRDDDRDYGT